LPNPPKPTQTQINEGDPRKIGVKKLQEKLDAQPIAERGLPRCPSHLKGRARKAWNFWKEALEGMNLDAKPDAMMLEGACVNYARAVEADVAIGGQGLVSIVPIFSKKGEHVADKEIAHPLIMVSNKAWDGVKKFCTEFGLSPAARTRLTIEKKDDGEAELRDLLTKPRTKEAVQ
jgi:P27 family predicted phage terminase small subunit